MLTEAQAQTISESVTKQRFRRGDLIVESGKKSNALFIILNGRAHVVAADGRGKEAILANLKQGDYIGEMSLIDNQPHSASVRAEVQTDVLVLGRTQFARILPENAAMTYAIMRVLVQRLRHADRKIESLALMDVYGRVAGALLELADVDTNGVTFIKDKVSRQNIAKAVGASREMVSRVMKDLEEKGYIENRRDGSLCIRQSNFAHF
jgi:CRP-like cAMP-binding protein